MEFVGFMRDVPTSRLFNREYEKTPSPEKEELASRVELDSEDLEQDFDMVLDFSDLDESLAEELEEIEDPWTGAGAKADVEDLPELAVAKDGKVMELVDQEYIRALLKSPPLTKPLPDSGTEAIRRRTGITDEEDLETVASSIRAMQRLRDISNDIIKQYLHKGYAYAALPENSLRYPATPGELPPLP